MRSDKKPVKEHQFEGFISTAQLNIRVNPTKAVRNKSGSYFYGALHMTCGQKINKKIN